MSDREERFLELIRENRGRLRRLCRVYGRGDADREDLHQEILAEAWRSLDAFRGDARPSTWLYRVALNTALGRRRKRRVRSEAVLDPDDPLLAREESPDPEGTLDQRRRLARLRSAIEDLDEADRAVVLLYLEDLSYAEMSEILGISESYVGVKLHRIRKKLAERLDDDNGEEDT